jgi:hypothetical protein
MQPEQSLNGDMDQGAVAVKALSSIKALSRLYRGSVNLVLRGSTKTLVLIEA